VRNIDGKVTAEMPQTADFAPFLAQIEPLCIKEARFFEGVWRVAHPFPITEVGASSFPRILREG
jgi:hypothetical protein